MELTVIDVYAKVSVSVQSGPFVSVPIMKLLSSLVRHSEWGIYAHDVSMYVSVTCRNISWFLASHLCFTSHEDCVRFSTWEIMI